MNGCIEVAAQGEQILVRDSKDPGGPILSFSLSEWELFVEGLIAGDFDQFRSER
jgi:hypothetical protein